MILSVLKSTFPCQKFQRYSSTMYLIWFSTSLVTSAEPKNTFLIQLQIWQNEQKSSFLSSFYLASYTRRGIFVATFEQYLQATFTLASSRFSTSTMQKGILHTLHQNPGFMFQILQFLQTFFSLKCLCWGKLWMVLVLFISILLCMYLFFLSFYYWSSSGASLNEIVAGPGFSKLSSTESLSSVFFLRLLIRMWCII